MEMHRTCAALACHLIGAQEMPPALLSTGLALSHLPTRVPGTLNPDVSLSPGMAIFNT